MERKPGSRPPRVAFRNRRVGASWGASDEYSTRSGAAVKMIAGQRSPASTAITRPRGSAPFARSRSVRKSAENFSRSASATAREVYATWPASLGGVPRVAQRDGARGLAPAPQQPEPHALRYIFE